MCGSSKGLSLCSSVLLHLLPPQASPQPGGPPPELLAADARLSRGLLSPSPGTHKEGEGSFPGPFPQPCSPADTNIRLLSSSYCCFVLEYFFPPPALTINQVAYPKGHLMQLVPHVKTTLQSSFPPSPPSTASARDAGSDGGRRCSLPTLSPACRSQAPFPGIAGRNPLARSSAPLLFFIPAPFPGEDGD